MRSRLVPILPLLVGLSACSSGHVARVFDGVEVPGRFISDWAYASYARGIEWEARGQHEEALRFFDEAVAQDPKSVELWTRVGALRCRLGQRGSDTAFDEGQALHPDYEPLWRARALCAERRGDKATALAHARLAVAHDPRREETVILLVRFLTDAKQYPEAERWLRSLAVASPTSTKVWEAVAGFARGRAPALLAAAELRLAGLQRTMDSPSPPPPGPPTWRAVDEALVAGELDLARRRTREAHLDVRWLAARAIFVGRVTLAREEASLRLGADPADSDTRVALALAAELSGDSGRAGEVLAALTSGAQPLSPTGQVMLAELILRLEGPGPAAIWLGVDARALSGHGAPRARLGRLLDERGRTRGAKDE